jgi:hypothetical protein
LESDSRQPVRTGTSEHRSWGSYSVGSHSHTKPSEDIVNSRDSRYAAVNCRVCDWVAGL